MPSHPDRVRRSYHEINIGEYHMPMENEQMIYIRISRMQIASCMSKREIEHNILRSIRLGIFEQYKE